MGRVSKIVSKALIVLCSTTFLNFSFISNSYALTYDDALYSSAYNSVQDALNYKNQQSINTAREYIRQMLNRSGLQFAVGEFSRQVDSVQQRLFEEFYSLIYINGVEKAEISQSDINKARGYVQQFTTYEGNTFYITSWSYKIDQFQGKKIIKANTAVEKAQSTKSKGDISFAKSLVNELSSSTNNDSFNEAKRLMAILNGLGENNQGTNDNVTENKPNTESKPEQELPKDGIVTTTEQFKIAIKKALSNFESDTTIKVRNYNNNDFSLNLVNKVVLENLEIDYGYSGVQATIMSTGIKDVSELKIKFNYRLSRQTMIQEKASVESKIQQIIAKVIKPGMSTVEREVAIHDYLVKNARYNSESLEQGLVIPEDYNAYGVLVKGLGVCESYAKAMHLLAKAANIQCIYVVGNAKGQAHAWNMVKLDDNKWYNIDVTWDDPVYNRDSDQFLSVRYNYFNVPDSIMNKTHKRGTDINYPVADGTKYVFDNLDIKVYDVNGNEFTKVNSREELRAKIKAALSNKKQLLGLDVGKLNMNLTQLSSEVNTVLKESSVNANGLSQWQVLSSGDKYIQYKFIYR